MKISCFICHEKVDITPDMTAVMQLETYTLFELEDHLRNKHTVEEIIRAIAKMHWQLGNFPYEPEIKSTDEYLPMYLRRKPQVTPTSIEVTKNTLKKPTTVKVLKHRFKIPAGAIGKFPLKNKKRKRRHIITK